MMTPKVGELELHQEQMTSTQILQAMSVDKTNFALILRATVDAEPKVLWYGFSGGHWLRVPEEDEADLAAAFEALKQ